MSSRPWVVYLDQCHWITLARATHSPEKINQAKELDAANHVLELAREGQIWLPLSAAHAVETAKAGDAPRRRRLADVMLSCYRGWHMRNPVAVRRYELRASLAALTPAAPLGFVFNPDPDSVFSFNEAAQASAQSTSQLKMAIAAVAWADVLRQGQYTHEELGAAEVAAHSWVNTHANLRNFLAGNPRPNHMKLIAAGRTLADLQQEIAEVAVSDGIKATIQDGLNETTIVEFFSHMPFVGRVTAVTLQRLRDPGDRWVSNDLNDIMFLCCAAGYADIVVAEKKTAHLLRNCTPDVTPGAAVTADLHGLVEVLGV